MTPCTCPYVREHLPCLVPGAPQAWHSLAIIAATRTVGAGHRSSSRKNQSGCPGRLGAGGTLPYRRAGSVERRVLKTLPMRVEYSRDASSCDINWARCCPLGQGVVT